MSSYTIQQCKPQIFMFCGHVVKHIVPLALAHDCQTTEQGTNYVGSLDRICLNFNMDVNT
jgi:hypothetical protein